MSPKSKFLRAANGLASTSASSRSSRRALVQVGAALGAQPLAVVVAQGHERHLEQQGRHDERHQIDLAVVRQEVELVAFHILRCLRFLLAADEEVPLDITLQAVGHVLQAAGALGRGVARGRSLDEDGVAGVGGLHRPGDGRGEGVGVEAGGQLGQIERSFEMPGRRRLQQRLGNGDNRRGIRSHFNFLSVNATSTPKWHASRHENGPF